MRKTQRTSSKDYEFRIRTLLEEKKSLQHDLSSKNSEVVDNNRNTEIVNVLTKEKRDLQVKVNELQENINKQDELHDDKTNIMKELELMTRRESAYEQRVNILKEKIGR